MSDFETIYTAVAKLYNTYPFPPEPLLNEPPPGYNWRWNWQAAYNFCTGQKPNKQEIRILDAGCGTGAGTEYLIYLNPMAEVVAIDISEKALAIASERIERSGVKARHTKKVEFCHLSLESAETLAGEFDLINCVGVLHHLNDPAAGIKSLAKKLAPGGLLHIFVYSELGRWEIQLMQEAIALLQQDLRGDYVDGVKIGRQLFASLPQNNRLVKREKERWAMDNHRDETFADMYVHPREVDYNIPKLFELIEASGLEFIGFSNPKYWQLERLIGSSPELMERASKLTEFEKYRLIEVLDPEITHYEFFVGRSPIPSEDWSNDEVLLEAIPEIHPCVSGWPSRSLFNYDYELVNLDDAAYEFLQKVGDSLSIREILREVNIGLEKVRSLQKQQLVILTRKN